MNSDENVYIQANELKANLLLNFKDIQNLYEMIHHLRGTYISRETACDFYELIMDRCLGRSGTGSLKASLIEEDAFDQIFKKANGLFTHYKKGELKAILKELERLRKANYSNISMKPINNK